MLPDVDFRTIARPNGIQLRTARLGEGPLVLFVHGFPEGWISWRGQLPVVAAAGYTAVALETRGYGESSKPAEIEAYTMVEMAGDIAAVIDAYGARDAVLVGHDWGAHQVYGAAVLHSRQVRGLVGLSVPAGNYVDRPPSSLWREMYPDGGIYQQYFDVPGEIEAQLQADVRGFLLKFLYALSGDRPDGVNALVRPPGTKRLLDGLPVPASLPAWLDAEDLDYYTRSFEAGGLRGPINRYRAQDLDVEQLRPYADRRITQPIAWMGGEKDPARFMVAGVDRYLAPAPRCTDLRRNVLVPGVGHWIQQEAPQAVNEVIVDFLRTIAD